MTQHDIVTVLSTCVIGFSVGVYMYFAGFVPQFLLSDATTAAQYDVFTVVGEQYGGCARASQCAAFQLLSDGTLSFVVGTNPPLIGQLSRSELRTLQAALSPTVVQQAAESVRSQDCISYRDGVDYYYEVTLDSTTYVLDTCTTALLSEPAAAAALDNVWNYFTMP